ncbi:unnamed protein product, partial [Mesorhabditis belari]|uniref:nucleoside-diphosphate kinase n=1 Tax=Mesorhabditis belari TaxID=2138241 RepID=A0AAF3F4P2_9BILA
MYRSAAAKQSFLEAPNFNGNAEKTVILVKATSNGCLGKTLELFENRGYRILALKQVFPSRDHLEKHFQEQKKHSSFHSLIDWWLSGPIVVIVLQGINIVEQSHSMLKDKWYQRNFDGFCHISISETPAAAVRQNSHWFDADELTD